MRWVNTGVMGWGWGPCRAGQLAYMLYRSAKVQQLMSSRGCSGLLIIPQVQRSETCAPSWRLADAGACRHMVSATPLHHRRSIQIKFHATAQHRAARTADSREHRHRSTAKASSQPLRPTPLRKPTRLLWAALAAVAAECSAHSPRFAQALLAGWLSPRAADCTSSGDLASHWTRRSSGETPAR